MAGHSHPSWRVLTEWERLFWLKNRLVAGTDEVGRGPLAGPVVAAAVILRPGIVLEGLDDSKRLSAKQREKILPAIMEASVGIAVAMVGPRQIERINILEASRLAMRRALERLPTAVQVVLCDGLAVGGPWQEWCLIGGDGRSASIAAASVVAKVVRDRYMEELGQQYPAYGFERHKGYGTPAHQAVLRQLGPCPAHRSTFIDHLGVCPGQGD